MLVVGAGLIGTETSGVLRQAGHPVTLVDAAATPMAPLVGPTVAEWILREHRAAGVDVRAGTTVQSLSPRADNSLSVTLSDGTQLTSAVVLAALGVTPDTDWLAVSGVLGDALAGAVAVDGQQRVIGRPGLYAAGDAAAVPGPDGRPVRIEHWGAALAQGRAAARAVLADLGVGEPEETSAGGRAPQLQHVRARYEADDPGLAAVGDPGNPAARHAGGRPVRRRAARPAAAPGGGRGRGWCPGGQSDQGPAPAPGDGEGAGAAPGGDPVTRATVRAHAQLTRRLGPWSVVLTLAVEALRTCARACTPGGGASA